MTRLQTYPGTLVAERPIARLGKITRALLILTGSNSRTEGEIVANRKSPTDTKIAAIDRTNRRSVTIQFPKISDSAGISYGDNERDAFYHY